MGVYIAFFVSELLFFLIFSCFWFIPSYCIEKEKYYVLKRFIIDENSNREIHEIILFIDSLHFRDREIALSKAKKLKNKKIS